MFKPMFKPFLALPVLALLACGGSTSNPTPGVPSATVLHYESPGTQGFRLEAHAGTNDTAHLVLDLVGPTGVQAQGVAFFLTCDPAVASWSSPGGDGTFARAGTVFDLSQGPTATVQLFRSKVTGAGANLQVGIFQKNGTVTLPPGAALVSVALDLAGKTPKVGATVALSAAQGKVSTWLDATGTLQPLTSQQAGTVDVGILTAR